MKFVIIISVLCCFWVEPFFLPDEMCDYEIAECFQYV